MRDILPINITFEVIQCPEPNHRWFEVTAILSWQEAGFTQRMETGLCWQDEISMYQEAIKVLIGRHFKIQEVSYDLHLARPVL